MSLIAASAIGAGASALGSLFNFGSQRSANKANKQLAAQQNEYNLALQDREFAYNTQASQLEYERNLEQWNLQNEYNSPASQIQRYQEAGLNPALIYGTGSASAGNASASPQYTAARYKSPHAERATVNAPQLQIDPYQAVQLHQALAIQKANANNLNAQADFTKQQTRNNQLDGLLKAEELTGRRLSNREKDALFEPLVMQAHINNRRASNQADLTMTQNRALQYDLEKLKPAQLEQIKSTVANLRLTNNIDAFRLKLLKIGVTDRDGFITRLASRVLLSNEDTVDSIIDTVKSKSDSWINKLYRTFKPYKYP